jgi:hypothetical protein
MALTGVVLASSPLFAGTLFYDDFEAPITPVTYWVDTTDDADPTTPVVGSNWVVLENIALYQIQEVNHPHDLAGPPWAGGAGPTFKAAPDGGDQYLHMWGYHVSNGHAWANIDPAGQAQIAAEQYVRVDIKTFALSGVDGWEGGLRLTGWDAPAGTGANRAFDVFLMKDGTVVSNVGPNDAGTIGNNQPYNVGYAIVPGLTHHINTWEDLTIEADFASDTFAITLDGVTVSGLPWFTAGLSKIQSVSLSLPHQSNPRGGWDNFLISVPEPAGLSVLGVSSTLLAMRRRR